MQNTIELIKSSKSIKKLEKEIEKNYEELVKEARRKPFYVMEVSDIIAGIEDKTAILDFIQEDIEIQDESLLFGLSANLHDDKVSWNDYVFINIPLNLKNSYIYMEQQGDKFKSIKIKNFHPFITDTRNLHTLFVEDFTEDIKHIYPYFLLNIPIKRSGEYNMNYLKEVFGFESMN